jgi:hypothetical protein
LADLIEHAGNVLKWGLALDLEGNGVQDLLSEIDFFQIFELVEDGEGSLGGFLQEDCISREGDVEDEENGNDALCHFFFFCN